VEFVCSTPAQLAAATSRLPENRCHLIEPGAASADTSRRDELRSRLGFRSDDRILLAPGASTRAAGHGTAVWVTSMLHIIDPRYKLLIPGVGPRVHDARLRAEALKRSELLRVASDTPNVCPADATIVADAALFVPEGPVVPQPLVDCLAAGLPVVAPRLPALRDVLTDRSTAFSETPAPPAVARRVLELIERPGLREQLAAGARAEAAERFGVAGFVSAYVDLYRQLADHSPVVRVARQTTSGPLRAAS
jgi:glycosyltransferase involved in cell wall biosynthesis